MIEIIDQETNKKVMAIVLCSICYKGDCYIVYAIQRDNSDANIFVSKLVKNSQGYVMANDFDNGEKESLDKIVQRFLNMESKDVLKSDGFYILNDIILDEINYFDINKCYVSTAKKSLIKNCLIHYDLVSEKLFEQPIVEVVDDKRIFNEGFVSNIVLIVFGVLILVFSFFVIGGVLFR